MIPAKAEQFAPAEIEFLRRDLKEMIWFADYLRQPIVDLNDAAVFARVVRTALEKHGVEVDAMAARFGINRSTVSRWKSGANAPQPFARATVAEWIEQQVRKRVEALKEELNLA